jgi:hypothetical protein
VKIGQGTFGGELVGYERGSNRLIAIKWISHERTSRRGRPGRSCCHEQQPRLVRGELLTSSRESASTRSISYRSSTGLLSKRLLPQPIFVNSLWRRTNLEQQRKKDLVINKII